jgi:hypothetical protein
MAKVAVLHQEAGDWGFTYFPLRYHFGAELPQYLVRTSGDTLEVFRLPDRERVAFDSLRNGRILVLKTSLQGFEALGAYIRESEPVAFAPTDLDTRLTGVGCRVSSRKVHVAINSTELEWVDCR